MNKFWSVYRLSNTDSTGDKFKTMEEAVADAQRRQAADNKDRYIVMEAKLITEQPVPNIKIIELK